MRKLAISAIVATIFIPAVAAQGPARAQSPATAGNQGGLDRLGPRGGRVSHKTYRAQFVQSVLGRSRLRAQICHYA